MLLESLFLYFLTKKVEFQEKCIFFVSKMNKFYSI